MFFHFTYTCLQSFSQYDNADEGKGKQALRVSPHYFALSLNFGLFYAVV